MEIVVSPRALTDIDHWKAINDIKIQDRITVLLEDIMRSPFSGIGKPEPLRYQLSGFWSRRINKEHHLVYRIVGNTIEIASARFHY